VIKTVTITVTQENATAVYTGPSLTWAATTSSTTATIPLRATIRDITAAVGDPLYDAYPGEIMKATVRFVDRENANATICTATLALIDASDAKTATATCNWTVSVSSQGADQRMIGIVVEGWYTRDTTDDNTIVGWALPLTSQFITGGGYLVLNNQTAGSYAGTVGSKTNFGFNVKYNNKGTNLQGRVNTIIRRNGRLYQVKANSFTSLGVLYCKADSSGVPTGCTPTPSAPCTYNASSTCPIKATFQAGANMQDVTNPAAPISLGGNATIQLDMVDYGEPGSNGPAGPDVMGITVWAKDGSLWYSSRWDGTKTAPQPLDGGNLVVH
jgi:hypothetical protein